MSDWTVNCQATGSLPKLYPLGITQAFSHMDSDCPPPEFIHLKPGQLVRHMQEDYVLFTPALIYLNIPWPVDPWLSFVTEFNLDFRTKILVSEVEMFGGLTDFWARHIQLPERPIAEAAVQYFGSLAVTDNKNLYRVRRQTIHLVEPYALKDSDRYTPVEAAVVDSTLGCYFYRQQKDYLGVVWSANTYNKELVFSDTANFQKALLASNNPYTGTQENPSEE